MINEFVSKSFKLLMIIGDNLMKNIKDVIIDVRKGIMRLRNLGCNSKKWLNNLSF